jgi:hypothetical protein
MHHCAVSLCRAKQQKNPKLGVNLEEVEMFVCLYWFELKGARVPLVLLSNVEGETKISSAHCSVRETSLKWLLLTALGCYSIYQPRNIIQLRYQLSFLRASLSPHRSLLDVSVIIYRKGEMCSFVTRVDNGFSWNDKFGRTIDSCPIIHC